MSSKRRDDPRNNDTPVTGLSCNRSDGRSGTDGMSSQCNNRSLSNHLS